jgi:peptide/nickel transport system ATP-binding protein
MADRIKVLRHGEEVEEQPTRALLSRPAKAYTRELLEIRHQQALEARGRERPGVLDIRGVSAAYGKTEVLTDIDARLHAGSSLAVVGESGSGKSTLARVIMGLLPPKSGRVDFRGEPLSAALAQRTRAQRKAIQMIYQLPDTALNPRHSVLDTIARPAAVFGGLSRADSVLRARELLRMVELDSALGESFPGQLSGGQKQRVCIARALAADPEVVICDEVTSALDPLVAQGILDLLKAMQEKLGVAYIFITHDIGMVRAVADDILVMRSGRIVEQGPRQEIFSPPYADYTELLITSTPETREGWLEQAIAGRHMQAAGN